MENISTNLNAKVLTDKRSIPLWLDRYALSLMTAAMICSDLIALLIAGGGAVLLRLLMLGPINNDIIIWIVPISMLMVIKFSLQQLYPATGLGVVEEFHRLTISISLIFIVVSTLLLVLKEGAVISRFIFVLFWLTSMMTIPALRLVIRHVMTRLELWGEPVAIIGALEPARRLYEQFRQDPKIGLRPVIILTPEKDGWDGTLKMPVDSMDRLEIFRQQNHVRVAAVLYDDLSEVEAICNRYRDTFERIALFDSNGNHFFFNKMQVQQYGGLISLEVRHSLLDPWAQTFKRVIDVVITGLALMVIWPFFVIGAGLIYLDSPGSIFYQQVRIGKKGKRFTLFKLRTMHLNADDVLSSTLEKDAALKKEWDKYQKLNKDPRITRVGKLLRRFSIDELAQLWNVLRGEMSLVGPRPILPNQQQLYGENYQHYVRVLPGISGLWQISGRNQTTFSRRAELDMEYVMSWSVWLDIYVMVRTVWVVLKRNGAV